MKESSIEAKLRDKVKALGGYCLKWVCPGHAGLPDRIILLPGSKIYFVELKQKGKKPDPLQIMWLSRLQALGFDASCVAGPEEVVEFLKRIS